MYKKGYQVCSGCNQRKMTVNRFMFDGMCCDCIDIALYSDDYTQRAERRNQYLIESGY